LALPLVGHYIPGSSNTTQTYSPLGSQLTPNSAKKSFNRPKSAEPGSPLLRRALSPDRLHPRTAESSKKSISPLCTPPLIVSTTPKMTQTTTRPPTEMSPLPSRALHTSPSSTTSGLMTSVSASEVGGLDAPVILRKHPKQSLSQPTIPEEGPEEELEAISGSGATTSGSASSTPVTSVLKPKPESRVVKNLAQELGAFSKDVASSLKKSNSFKDDKSNNSSSSSMESIESAAKSPKLSRTESIGERTIQKISKVIRGSSRSDSRSKKTREASVSPQGGPSKKKSELSSKEKRDLYKSSGERQ